MADTKTFYVKRQHTGDRPYAEGDVREAVPSEVAHLVANGVLVEKAAPAHRNKAEPPLENKADDPLAGSRDGKGGQPSSSRAGQARKGKGSKK